MLVDSRVLCIDPGLSHCGIAVLYVYPDRKTVNSLRFTVEYTETVGTKTDITIDERLKIIVTRLNLIVEQYRPAQAVVEFPPQFVRIIKGKPLGDSLRKISMVYGAVAGLCMLKGIHVISINPTSEGRGIARKKRAVNLCKSFGIECKNTHEADAILLGFYYIR